jgi:hypothetical protein
VRNEKDDNEGQLIRICVKKLRFQSKQAVRKVKTLTVLVCAGNGAAS